MLYCKSYSDQFSYTHKSKTSNIVYQNLNIWKNYKALLVEICTKTKVELGSNLKNNIRTWTWCWFQNGWLNLGSRWPIGRSWLHHGFTYLKMLGSRLLDQRLQFVIVYGFIAMHVLVTWITYYIPSQNHSPTLLIYRHCFTSDKHTNKCFK